MARSITQPKTIFELLGLPSSATRAEVVNAYQALCRHYESGAHGLSATMADYKLTSLRAAMESYSSGDMGTRTVDSRAPSIMVSPPPVIWSEIDGETPHWAQRRKKFAIMTSWTSTGLKFLVGLLGLIFLFKMMFSFTFSQASNADANNLQTMSKQQTEQIMIQEYFNETGYLASSASEVAKLRARDKLIADERRAELQEQREEEARQKEYERFVKESRRMGEKVSLQLQRDEERQRRQEERQRQLEAQEEQRRIYQEQERVRLEKERINAERRRLGMKPVY